MEAIDHLTIPYNYVISSGECDTDWPFHMHKVKMFEMTLFLHSRLMLHTSNYVILHHKFFWL